MMHVHKSLHGFIKTNPSPLSDQVGFYDSYECKNCGLKGKQRDGSEFIEVEDTNKTCTAGWASIRVKLTNNPGITQFGFSPGQELNTVPCPKEWDHSQAHRDAAWVYSPVRNEPVRLLHSEYQVSY